MATPRLHPNRYAVIFWDAFRTPQTIACENEDSARRLRQRMYAFREALREFPNLDPDLLKQANSIRITVSGDKVTTKIVSVWDKF